MAGEASAARWWAQLVCHGKWCSRMHGTVAGRQNMQASLHCAEAMRISAADAGSARPSGGCRGPFSGAAGLVDL